MNLRTRIWSNSTPTKLLLAICLLMLTGGFKCSDDELFPEPPPFPGGIRVQTKEALNGFSASAIPVGNVPNSGILTKILGPGSGQQDSFAGPTNPNGFRDWPLVRTNATWTFSVSYTTVIPICGGKTMPGIFVPSTGISWVWICFI